LNLGKSESQIKKAKPDADNGLTRFVGARLGRKHKNRQRTFLCAIFWIKKKPVGGTRFEKGVDTIRTLHAELNFLGLDYVA